MNTKEETQEVAALLILLITGYLNFHLFFKEDEEEENEDGTD